MSKVLLTGATGFLGHHISNKLLAEGRQVRALVRSIEKAKKITAETVTHLTERDVQRLLALLDKI